MNTTTIYSNTIKTFDKVISKVLRSSNNPVDQIAALVSDSVMDRVTNWEEYDRVLSQLQMQVHGIC